MTTASAGSDESGSKHPLAPPASPAAIREALLPSDTGKFDDDYAAALESARGELDLQPVFDMLEQWRRIAILQRDPENFRRIVVRVAEHMTGEPVPPEEPFEVTRQHAGL